MAIITPKSEEILNVFGRARRAHEVSGAALFGSDLGDWPIWAVDAAEIIRVAEIVEQNARSEAEAAERT